MTILLTLGLGLAGCGGGGASGSGPSRREATGFHDSLLGIRARVPAGWSARDARFGGRQLRLDLIASSSRISTPPGSPLTPSSHFSPCPSNTGTPPPGEVGVLLYEHPSLDGGGLAQHETWFSSRPDHFHLGNPSNEEGYYGFNLFFQDHGRALQAQVCLHRGSRFGARRRGQTERFLDSLSFSAPRPDPIGWGSATKTCHGVFAGSGERGWRRQAASAGPFGFGGAGRDFHRMPRRERDGLFHTKMPALVEGHRTVELSVPPDQRDRVGIEVVPEDHPLSRVIFRPCDDKLRTIWPAGLALANRSPLTLTVRVGTWVGDIKVGRVPGRSS